MSRELKIIKKSATQNFFLSWYLFLRFFFFKKINNKKIKKSVLDIQYKDFIKRNLRINEDWFTNNIKSLDFFFKKFNYYDKNINALEIGSYEGNSSVFFLKYFKNLKLTCVDTFKGSLEQDNKDFNQIFENFNYNLRNYLNRINVHKSPSKKFFENINNQKFDLIYIDGSHYAKDVYEDAINSFKILKKGGFLIFDDFLWDFYSEINDNPIGGIKLFIKMFFFKIRIVSINYQIIIQKL